MNTARPHSQAGSAIFYILIAVVLLGALTYAVSQTTRNNPGNITAERARMFATEIIEDANSFASAVSQIRLRGVALTSLCFDDTGWGAATYTYAACSTADNKIFDPSGGGIAWSEAPAEAMDSTASPDNLWAFYGDNEVAGVGTTTGDSDGADLLLMVDELSLPVCQQINDLLGVTDKGATPPTDTDYGITPYKGAFSYSQTIGDEDTVLYGKNAACFQNTTTGHYAFYKVLVTR